MGPPNPMLGLASYLSLSILPFPHKGLGLCKSENMNFCHGVCWMLICGLFINLVIFVSLLSAVNMVCCFLLSFMAFVCLSSILIFKDFSSLRFILNLCPHWLPHLSALPLPVRILWWDWVISCPLKQNRNNKQTNCIKSITCHSFQCQELDYCSSQLWKADKHQFLCHRCIMKIHCS